MSPHAKPSMASQRHSAGTQFDVPMSAFNANLLDRTRTSSDRRSSTPGLRRSGSRTSRRTVCQLIHALRTLRISIVLPGENDIVSSIRAQVGVGLKHHLLRNLRSTLIYSLSSFFSRISKLKMENLMRGPHTDLKLLLESS
jgi:hypothetical protein